MAAEPPPLEPRARDAPALPQSGRRACASEAPRRDAPSLRAQNETFRVDLEQQKDKVDAQFLAVREDMQLFAFDSQELARLDGLRMHAARVRPP